MALAFALVLQLKTFLLQRLPLVVLVFACVSQVTAKPLRRTEVLPVLAIRLFPLDQEHAKRMPPPMCFLLLGLHLRAMALELLLTYTSFVGTDKQPAC
tara:strand:- start:643 stop:936 length:294 start_codon:yes stop_codon:yes gene_type:complete